MNEHEKVGAECAEEVSVPIRVVPRVAATTRNPSFGSTFRPILSSTSMTPWTASC